ncbi:MAG: AAA family ATPase [Pseudomonadota bacterium]
MPEQRLHLRLFNGPLLTSPTGEPVRFPTKKSAALLCYLSQRAGEDIPREVLADLFWPNAQEEQARGSLRQELAVIRKMLSPWGVNPIDADRHAVTYRSSPMLILDTDALSRNAEESLDVYTGPFLGRMRLRSDEFERWCQYVRQSFHETALAAAIAVLQASKDAEAVAHAATRVLEIEPASEDAHRALIQLHLEAGNRDHAIRQFDACEAALAARFDVGPSQETLALREMALSGAVLHAPKPAAVQQTRPTRKERRDLTLLVVGLSAETLENIDPEDFEVLAEQIQGIVTAEAKLKDGRVISSENCSATICFGVPQASEYDADNAVIVAERVMAALDARLGKQGSGAAGISRGKALATRFSDGHDPLDVRGAVQSAAAAMQALAKPGHVACDQNMRSAVSLAIQLDEVGPYLRATRTNALVKSAAPGDDLALVGREAELELLWQRFKEAQAGHGQALIVEGPPGIGKSRLSRALMGRATEENAKIMTLQGDPHATGDALRPLRHALLEQMFQDGTDLAHFLAGLGLAEAQAFFEMVLYSETRPAAEVSGRARKKAMSILRRVIERASVLGPVVLVCDDVQWFDPTTLETVLQVVNHRSRSSVFVLCLARAAEVPDVLSATGIQTHELKPLLQTSSKTLVAQILPDSADVQEAVEIVSARAEGHPLALEEFAKALRAEIDAGGGAIERSRVQALVGAFEAPASLGAMFLNRLDRVPEARRLIESASVLGIEVQRDDVASLTSSDHQPSADDWDALVQGDILIATGSDTFRFKHALLQDTIYKTILNAERPGLHQRAAELFLNKSGEDALDGRIAFHFAAAGNEKRAAEHYEAAGMRATQLAAHQEAIEHFEAALEMCKKVDADGDTLPKQLMLTRLIGAQTIADRGHPIGAAEGVYRRARSLAEALGNTEEIVRADWGLWGAALIQADFKSLPLHTATLQRQAASENGGFFVPALHFAHGVHSLYVGKLPEAEQILRSGLAACRTARRLDYEQQFGMDFNLTLRSYLAWALALQGDVNGTLDEVAASLREADVIDHDFAHAFANVFGATACLFANHSIAEERVAAAQYWAKRGNLPIWRAQANLLSGRVADLNGDESGLGRMQKALDQYLSAGSVLAKPYAGAWIVEALMTRGDVTSAERVLSDTFAFTQRTGEVYFDGRLDALQRAMNLKKASARTTSDEPM